MSLLPSQIPFERVAIENIESVEDMKRWLHNFMREFDAWYENFYSNIIEGGFLANTWRVINNENGDLEFQKWDGAEWQEAGIIHGS
jgi:hypothetical protein